MTDYRELTLEDINKMASRTWFGVAIYDQADSDCFARVWANDDLAESAVIRSWIEGLMARCPTAKHGVVYDLRRDGLAMGGFVRHVVNQHG